MTSAWKAPWPRLGFTNTGGPYSAQSKPGALVRIEGLADDDIPGEVYFYGEPVVPREKEWLTQDATADLRYTCNDPRPARQYQALEFDKTRSAVLFSESLPCEWKGQTFVLNEVPSTGNVVKGGLHLEKEWCSFRKTHEGWAPSGMPEIDLVDLAKIGEEIRTRFCP